MNAPEHRTRAGFTLIEVLIGLSIGLIALAALPTTQRITAAATVTARDGTMAVAFAQAKLEELMADPARRVAGEDAVTLPGTATTFTRAWRIARVPRTPGVLSLSTTVSWNDDRHEIRMETSVWNP